MKAVKATWTEENNTSKFKTYDDFLNHYIYIGFIPEEENKRFIITKSLTLKGTAFRYDMVWNRSGTQENEKGTYYVFKTAKKLYKWLSKEGEKT